MKKNISTSDWHKFAAVAWATLLSLIMIILISIIPGSKLNTSVMALLPRSEIKDVPVAVLDEFNHRLDQQLIWLISAPTAQESEQVAGQWVAGLQNIAAIQKVNGKIGAETQQQWGKYIDANRVVLLDAQTRQQLLDNTHISWVLGQFYSPFAGVSAAEINRDPLLLTRSLALSQQKNSGALKMCHNWLCGTDPQGKEWIMIRAELNTSSYDIHTARQTIQALNSLHQQLQSNHKDLKLLQRGTLFYSQYASEQAEKDITTIGLVSIFGIILINWLIFHSLKPLWLTLLSIGTGLLCGTALVLLVYGEIHIITLVMSTSIIGVSIDYALLYLIQRMTSGKLESAQTSMQKLFMPLFGALVSTVIAYLCMIFVPFSGLQQFSVFAVSGLIAAFLTVVCWFPFLVKKLPVRAISPRTQALLNQWLALWQHTNIVRYGVPLICLVISIIGLSRLNIDDDISKLQALPAHLQQQDQQIAQITGQKTDQKWFVVTGITPENTLQKLEQLTTLLTQAKNDSVLKQFRTIPLPSINTQQQNIKLVQEQIPLAQKELAAEGLSIQAQEIPQKIVTPEQWLKSPVSEGWNLLYSSVDSGHTAILVPLEGIQNEAVLKNIPQQISGVYWVDRKTEISELFSTYRYYMGWLLSTAVALIALLFLIRFKPKHGLKCLLPLILSLSTALASLGLIGIPLNLFSMMGLILVLGIGIDYTLFFSNPKGTGVVSLITIIAAAFISELTFGLLAFSQTQAIAGFGTVLSVGIIIALLLSPLAMPLLPEPELKVENENHNS